MYLDKYLICNIIDRTFKHIDIICIKLIDKTVEIRSMIKHHFYNL